MASWPKGISGNPHGRPKGSLNRSTAEIRDLLDKHVSFDNLVKKLDALARRGNVKAAEILLEYRYGKPKGVDELRIGTRIGCEEMREIDEANKARMNAMTTDELSQELVRRLKVSSQGLVDKHEV